MNCVARVQLWNQTPSSTVTVTTHFVVLKPRDKTRVQMHDQIEVGYMAFVSGHSTGIGAVRQVAPEGRAEIVIYVENAGDFIVPIDAVEAVESQKVILNGGKLDRRFREAIGHAHDAEDPAI